MAHSDERTKKSPVTNEMRACFASLRLYIDYKDKSLDPSDMPAYLPKILRSNINRIDESVIKKTTGLRRKNTAKTLDDILSRFVKKQDGRFHLPNRLNEKEFAVLSCSTRSRVRPAFTDETPWNGFVLVLQKNRLLMPNEAKALRRVRPGVTLYAVAAMHRTEVSLGDDGQASLMAGVLDPDIAVFAGTMAKFPDEAGRRELAFPVFTTSLKATEWCNFDPVGSVGAGWRHPVEIGTDQKLSLL